MLSTSPCHASLQAASKEPSPIAYRSSSWVPGAPVSILASESRATLWLIAQNRAAREGWDRKMLPPDDDADRGPLTDDELRWMDELNQEGARRGLPDWPRPDEIMHRRTCWMEDYAAGKTPREAIDKISHAHISVAIPLQDLESINQFLATTHDESVCPYQVLDLPRLAAMLLEDVALMVRRPGSWEGSNMAQVMASHGYSF